MASKFWSRYWEKQFSESIATKAAFFTKAAATIYLIREHVAELTVVSNYFFSAIPHATDATATNSL
jgi:hypothetical protein